jgi:short subunit dehydrogenase-like uncharacterized protein
MPYIKKERREVLDPGIISLTKRMSKDMTAGDLNYVITKLILRFNQLHGLSYSTINDIVGVLESAKAEYQRRVVSNYENQKCVDNGEVY